MGLGLSAFAARKAVAARAAKPFFGKRRPIGAQCFPVNALLAADPEGTLAKIAALGYREIETAGLQGLPATRLRAAADSAGLPIVSAHVHPQLVRAPGERTLSLTDLPYLCENLATLGVRTVVMPLMLLPDGALPKPGADLASAVVQAVGNFSLSDWQRNAEFLNDRGRRLREAGIDLAYHNHSMEFAPVGATTGWDILLRETDPGLVHFQLDIGWAVTAGQDPAALLRGHAGRIKSLHMKDVVRHSVPNYSLTDEGADVGKGAINWPDLLNASDRTGVRHYFVEREPPFSSGPFAALAQAIEFLSRVQPTASERLGK